MFYTRQLPPTVIDVAYEVGDLWLDQPSGRVWRYAGPGQWEPWSTSAGKPVGAEQLFPGPDGSDIGLADAPTSDGLYALGVDGGDIEWAEIEGLPPVGDDGDVLTVVDGAWAAGPPAADWVWLEGQPTETAGNPGLLVLGSVPFPDWQPGLSVEWQAHVTVVDNPNSTNLISLTVRVSDDDTGDVDVSQNGIAQDAPGGFQDAFALAGSFTVGTHSIFGTIGVGNVTRTKNTSGSNVATVFGIPSEPIGTGEVLRLVATKAINSAGLALKVMSFGYRVIRPAD